MPTVPRKYPFYVRATIILFGLILFSYALADLRDILIPFSFALFLAILLNPLVDRLMIWRIPRVAAILIALLVAIVVIGGVWYFLATQMMHFTSQLPALEQKTQALVSKLQQDLARKIPLAKQNQYIVEAKAGIKPLVGRLLGSVFGTLTTAFLLPVYTFLLVYYKTLILNFLYDIFAKENEEEVRTVLRQTRGAIQSYMYGLLIEGLIVASLNTLALLILGVPYAVLLGVLGAILNVLPFFGGILSTLLPVLVATIVKDGFSTQIWVCVSYMIIQFADNHFFIPYIVSAKVKINALISIVVVLLGGAVWGLSGMFLSIPFIGVLKIIFDRIPEMKPWGRLLGDNQATRKLRTGRIPGKRTAAVSKTDRPSAE
ncbi:AI-2E family transporter [Puia sp.]|jgi:predicted PurR-regulated permease PerM|uniref:AI-2E family transporter n=1 Tax=Puia sp. TaxID=2045100 RepID=UPI002F3E8EDC